MAPLLVFFWLLFSFAIALASVITSLKSHLPQAVRDLFFYGKMRGERSKRTFVQLIEIPKRWFTYFYILGVVVNGTMFFVVSNAYMRHQPLPAFVDGILRLLSSRKETSTDALAAILLIGMMFVQDSRRFLECIFVSVYSKSTMNLVHFMLGVVLYCTFALSVLVEAPLPTDSGVVLRLQINHIIGLLLFAWASWHHHEAHVTFGQLRKNKTGDVVNYQHSIPQGGWFEYVSCPHYFMEILIYLSFAIVGGFYHKTLMSIVFFVFTNQLVASHWTHSWYKQQFRSYPPKRKAVLPYIF